MAGRPLKIGLCAGISNSSSVTNNIRLYQPSSTAKKPGNGSGLDDQ
jgi:hypothetical protein